MHNQILYTMVGKQDLFYWPILHMYTYLMIICHINIG